MSPEAEAFTSNKRDASVPAIGHVLITSNHSYSSITVLTPRTDHPQIDTGSPHGIYDNRLPPRKHTVPSFYCSHSGASYSISKSLVYIFPIGTCTSTEPPHPLFYQARFTVIYEFPEEKESGGAITGRSPARGFTKNHGGARTRFYFIPCLCWRRGGG